MGSGGSQSQQQAPGTLSPITATVLSLFGTNPDANEGQFAPTTGLGQGGGVFSPQDFSALPGLLQNMPQTGVESAFLGGAPTTAQAGALQGQDLLNRTASSLTIEPSAAIAQARRGFEQETVPGILERAPGFSSSDLQRELTRGGVDLETNIGALRDAHQLALAQTVPGFADKLGTYMLDQATQQLGFGQLGREFTREVGPAGDAFRVLTALQSLTGPALTTQGSGKSKNVGVL